MVKAFALLGCVAAVFFFQGCGGKKAETPPADAATPDMAGTPGGGAGASMPGGMGDGSSAMPGGSGSNDLASMSGVPGGMPGPGDAGMPGSGYMPGPGDASMPGSAGMPTPGDGGNFPPGFDPNGMPGQSNRPRKPLPPPTIKEQAVMAFQAGNAKRAYTLLQAHALQLSDEEAAEILKDYRWAGHAKRPQLGVNIAVGLTIKNPMKFTDLAPIGSDNKNAGGAGGGDLGMGQAAGMGGIPGEGADSTKPKSLIESTGILSSRLAQAFKASHEKGALSPAFKDYWLSTGRNASGELGANGMGGFGIGGNDGGRSGEGAMPGGFSGPGDGAMPFGEAGGMPGMGDPQFGGPSGPSPSFSNNAKLPSGLSPITPCLTFIGEDELLKLMKKAVQDGYDALMTFEVTIGANRALQMVTNDTLIRVVQPNIVSKDVKRVFLSNTLNNLKVVMSKRKGEPDGIDEEMERVVKGTEKGIGLQDIPATLTPQLISTNRLPALIKETERSVVDRLSEINFYYYKGYIDENQKAGGFEQIAGEPGRVIAIGTPSEKLAAVEKLLEREFK